MLNSYLYVPIKHMKKALLIGINYTGSQHELHGCINDIVQVSQLLKSAYGFEDVRLLTDATPSKPTYDSIIAGLRDLFAGSKQGDQIVIYYSGHGTQLRDTSGDEKDGFDEAMYTIDGRFITDDQIFSFVEAANGATVNLFFDCCHSGTICDLEYNMQPMASNRFNFWTESRITKQNVVVFSGCMDQQTSADASFMRANNEHCSNGAFTYMLLQVLKEKPSPTNKDVLYGIFEKLAQNGFAAQVPQLSCSNMAVLNKTFLSL